MTNKSRQTGAAIPYAAALLALANERKQAESIGAELESLKAVLAANPVFGQFLSDPGISEAERAGILHRVLKGHIADILYNTLGVMNSKGRLRLLPSLIDTYKNLLDQQLGKIEADVTVAQKLPPQELEEVRRRIGQAFKKEAVVHQRENPSIIGGLVIRIGDKLIDASVVSQLNAMKKKLLSAAR